PNLHDLPADTEILQHRLEQAGVLFERVLVDRLGLDRRRLCQELERRQYRLCVRLEVQGRLAPLIGTFPRRQRLCPGRNKANQAAALPARRLCWFVEMWLVAVPQRGYDSTRTRLGSFGSAHRRGRPLLASPVAEQSIG